MNDRPRLLAVDDDPDVRWMIKRYLTKHGFAVDTADGGVEMRALLARGSYDLIILDITMPGEDGLTLARYLREHHPLGIIMLSAASEVVDRVIGLEVGADDYLTKPCEPRELLARVKSVLRRLSIEVARRDNASTGTERVRFGDFALDLDSRRLYDAEQREIALTSMEFDMLKAFAEHPDKVLNRDQLLKLARHRDWDPFDRSVDIRIARLRRKIEQDPAKPRLIKTVRGAGYIFVTKDA